MKKTKEEERKGDCDEWMKNGHEKLKPSCWKCFVDPNALEAHLEFSNAAKGYKKLGYFNEEILALDNCAECNHKLRLYRDEASNYKDIAYIYMKRMNNYENMISYMIMASKAYQYDNQYKDSILILNDICRELIPAKKYTEGSQLAIYAFDEGIKFYTENIVSIILEDTCIILLDILCEIEDYTCAIEKMNSLLEVQKETHKSKRSITETYLKLAFLRIIIGEVYMAEKLKSEMYAHYERGDSTIEDLTKLINAFKKENKKDLNFSLNHSFSLFPNGLLKAIRKAFDLKKNDNQVHSMIQDHNKIDEDITGEDMSISFPRSKAKSIDTQSREKSPQKNDNEIISNNLTNNIKNEDSEWKAKANQVFGNFK